MGATGYVDACGFVPTTGGTGNFVVSSAVTGYQTPASAGAVNATVYSYRAESADKTQWEEGFGAYTVSTTTLARSTITANSSGGTTAINFASAPNVFITAASADLQNASLLTSGTLPTARLGGMSAITASLSADVTMTPANTYVDGPSVAQGSSGTWFASGSVTLNDASGATQFSCKLWDGTTVIASAQVRQDAANEPRTIALSGFISSPAGNIRMSCRDINFATGTISFNLSGSSKDSTVTAIRIG